MENNFSKEFAELVRSFGIKHQRTTICSPQTNASERVNKSILASIRSYLLEDYPYWDKYLSEIEFSLRSSVQTAIGVMPYFVLFGFNMFGSMYALA